MTENERDKIRVIVCRVDERGEIQTKYMNFMGYTEKNGELVIVPEDAAQRKV